MRRLFLGFVCWTSLAANVYADAPQPQAQPEPLPAPRLVPPPVQYWIEPYTPRTGSIEVWQHYGVNRLGRFVPRVIMLPDGGAYYSRDLQPFPWVPRTAATMPYAN